MFQRYFQILRSIHRSYPAMVRKPAMPGIRHQLSALENDQDLVDDPETLEELEADFMNVGKTQKQHEAELQAQRERLRQIIVKNKYFPEQQLPNLLLYAEKEEIRNLHAKDPEEWTIERLAESFPATPNIIRKILKGKWRPYTVKRKRAHDETVIHNWEQVKHSKGSSNDSLPQELREHIDKFASRTRNHLTTEQYEKDLVPRLPKPKSKEFVSIITSCKKYASKSKAGDYDDDGKDDNENVVRGGFSKSQRTIDPEDETYLIDKIKDQRRMRLNDWKQSKMQDLPQLDDGMFGEKNQEEHKIVVFPENPSGTGFIQKFETTTNEIVISPEDSKRYEMSTYKEQVHIPRKLWRKGATYRIEDCYYDDDGEFLYRVPGMSGSRYMADKEINKNK